tara:strand:- start:69 stop:464 length:396 start_codon:yes stop_codon:yes gene_type:complete
MSYKKIRDSDKIRTEEEQDSLDRQRRTREEARNRKAARRAEKEKLSKATSTSERREIREDFKEIQEAIEEGAIFDIDTGKLATNQDDITRSIKDEGIDVISTDDLGPLTTEVFDVVESDNKAGTRTFYIQI